MAWALIGLLILLAAVATLSYGIAHHEAGAWVWLAFLGAGAALAYHVGRRRRP